jgi:hypothetical protein
MLCVRSRAHPCHASHLAQLRILDQIMSGTFETRRYFNTDHRSPANRGQGHRVRR